MESCTSRLCAFEFDRAANARAAVENRLLTMEIGMIGFIQDQGMDVEMCTNGSGISAGP